jgi:hypothetical protein
MTDLSNHQVSGYGMGRSSWQNLRRIAARRSHALRLLTVFAIAAAVGIGGAGRAGAQALPAATADPISTGFQLPSAAGTLNYSVGASGYLTSGYNGSGWYSAAGLVGNVATITTSKRYPFSLIASGGYFWSIDGAPATSFVDLGASQVVNTKNWSFILSDMFSYLPGTPTVGLSGVPGTGNLGVPPIQLGIGSGQGILTNYSKETMNAISLNVTRRITGRLSAQGAGSYSAMRFLGNAGNISSSGVPYGAGLDSDGYTGSGGLSYMLDARNTFSTNYMYSTYQYNNGYPGFISQTAMVGFTRRYSRRLTLSLFAGPQWTTTQATAANFLPIPGAQNITELNAYISAGLNYTTRITNYSLNYSRGTNAGYGVIAGSRTDSVTGTASRTFARYWNVAADLSYMHSAALGDVNVQGFAPNALIVSAQASRALGRSVSMYGSYTLEKQTGTGSGSVYDVFNGSIQTIGFGMTYAPPTTHFGPH